MLYKREIVDEILKTIDLDEIIVLHGARQVGKTSIMVWLKNHLSGLKKKCYYIDLEDSRYKKILDAGTDGFITLLKEEGRFPAHGDRVAVFIDEIQYLQNPSEFLKLVADHHKNIKLIVSGSSSFGIKSKFKDSLAGRTFNFEIFNLSFLEYLEFKNYYYDPAVVASEKKISELKSFYKEYVLFGGYPKITLTDEIDLKEKRLWQIIDTYVKKDIAEIGGIGNVESFIKLLEVLAAQGGQLVNTNELAATCKLARATVEKYLFILEETYIIKLVRPYSGNIRSEISKMPKVFFYDTGIMQMLWLKSLQKEIIGNVFETSVFAELAKARGRQNIYYWRTKDKKEIDFIVKDKNIILPIEAKLNFSRADLTPINYFSEHYKPGKYIIAGFDGKKTQKEHRYPWEMI